MLRYSIALTLTLRALPSYSSVALDLGMQKQKLSTNSGQEFSVNFEARGPRGQSFRRIFAAKAAVRTSPRLRDELQASEVDDHVRRADDGVVLVRRDAERALFSRARVLASTGGPDLLRRVDGSRLA
jgi:hypothetical protein